MHCNSSLSSAGCSPVSPLIGFLRYCKCDHKKTPAIFSSLELLRYLAQNFLQEVLAEVPVLHLEVDVFLDIRMAGLVKDSGDLVVADPP